MYVDSMIQGLQTDDWVYSWKELSGVSWISRLTRDREAELRAAAYLLIERAASDSSGQPLVAFLKVVKPVTCSGLSLNPLDTNCASSYFPGTISMSGWMYIGRT